MTLKSLYKFFASHPENRWIMEAQNAEILYNFIQKHPIKRVLDLGCGIGLSAAVCALALKDKGETDYHIDSIEQFDKCIKIAKKLIPLELQEHITIHKSEVVSWQTNQIPYLNFSIFETLPEGEWDLIINDGPAPFLKDGHLIDLPNATVTELLLKDKLKPGTFIAWDGRQHMIKPLERFYGDNFWLVRPSQRGDDMNILERKNTAVIFRDDLLDNMRFANYFKDNEENINPNHGPSSPREDAAPHTGTGETL